MCTRGERTASSSSAPGIDATASTPPKEGGPADPADLEAIAAMRRALPLPTHLATLLGIWGSSAFVDPPRSLGFGLQRRQVRFRNGRGVCLAWVVSRDSENVEMLASCLWRLDAFQSARSDLEQSLGPEFRLEIDLPHSDAIFASGLPQARAVAFGRVPAAYEAALAAAARDLGARGNAEVPRELAEAYQALSSPSFELALGTVCNFSTAPGLVAADRLRNAGRVDLLRGALRGLNPEGRYYAGHALRQLGADDDADRITIAALPRVAPRALFCFADVTEERSSADAFHWLDERSASGL
jgi:hypothetical protein